VNAVKLASVLREHADKIRGGDPAQQPYHMDTAELIDVLARVVEGKPLAKAFGAPGDWGYGKPIGDALAGRE
jgi:hypothetical protein